MESAKSHDNRIIDEIRKTRADDDRRDLVIGNNRAAKMHLNLIWRWVNAIQE